MATQTIRGFMCKVEWEHDFPDSNDGGKVYVTLEDLKRNSPCVDQCGIVEVEVKLVRVVQESDFLGRDEHPVIMLREIPDEVARMEIEQMFEDATAPLYYDEINERLRLPLEQVVRVCNEQLMPEGLVGVLEEAH